MSICSSFSLIAMTQTWPVTSTSRPPCGRLRPDGFVSVPRDTVGRAHSVSVHRLDRKNPRAKEDISHLPPAQLAADILKKEQRIAEIMGNIQKLLAQRDA